MSHAHTHRKALVAAGMALVLSTSFAGPALADNPKFSPTQSAGQAQQAVASAAAYGEVAAASDVWVQDSIELSSDEYARWNIANANNDVLPYIIRKSGDGQTLLDANGNVLSDTYTFVNKIKDANHDYPYFSVQNENGINNKGCLDATGTLFTDMVYFDFEFFDEHWLAALQVEEVDQETTHEYLSSDGYLRISHVDLFYDSVQVASLDRDAYDDRGVVAIDGYLLVRSRSEDVYSVYAPTGEVVNQIAASYWDEDEYYAADDGTLRHVSGAQVGVPDCTLTYDDVEQPYLIGEGGTVIYDIYGNQVGTLDFSVSTMDPFHDGYARVYGASANGSGYGVIDENWNTVIPCEYDQIGSSYSSDVVFTNGYCYAEKDDKFGYLASDGSVAVPLEYDVNTLKDGAGNLFSVISADDGYHIVSATDGLEDAAYSDSKYLVRGSISPIIAVANVDGLWGLVDYHGNVILDYSFEYSTLIQYTADGSLVLTEAGSSEYSATLLHIATSWDDADEGAAEITDPAAEQPAEATEQPTAEPTPAASAPADQSATAEQPAERPTESATEPTPADSSAAASADAASSDLTSVTYGGLTIEIPSAWSANATQDETKAQYTNDAQTIAVAIYDVRTSELPADTDYATYFAEVAQQSASQYAGATVETLDGGDVDGIEAYAFGIVIPAGDNDVYVIVQIYVPLEDGFSFVQLGYDELAASDADKDTLTQIIDSISLESSATADAATPDAATKAVSSLHDLFS